MLLRGLEARLKSQHRTGIYFSVLGQISMNRHVQGSWHSSNLWARQHSSKICSAVNYSLMPLVVQNRARGCWMADWSTRKRIPLLDTGQEIIISSCSLNIWSKGQAVGRRSAGGTESESFGDEKAELTLHYTEVLGLYCNMYSMWVLNETNWLKRP